MESDDLDTNGILNVMADSGIDYWAVAEAHPWWHAFTWANNLTHDLYHVLTGYARDAVGEAAVQAITGHVLGSRGSTFIGVLGGLQCRRAAPGLPVGKIMREANAIGAKAGDFVTTDLVALLPLPLEEARRRLDLDPPLIYWSAGRDLLDTILKPKAA
jgi:ubiquinone biosynthesis protein COQ4